MIGHLLGNRYEIISQLGGGGMALVYKARDTLLNRPVTVKMLRSEYTGDEEFVARFRKEAQAVAKLSHPNIVSVYDVGQEGDKHYIVMEFVEGWNLKQIIRDQGKLPVNHAVDIARQICDALEHAHEHGIVHRDIKPHNILVTDSGRVKVADFGIAQMMSTVTITSTDTIVGSVHYFSPEQAKGGTTGAKSDIYSVGVVLYEMLTGKVPFEGETPIAVALKHIQDQPLPPGRLNPEIAPELERIILRAMEKDVTLRYRTAGDMSRDLRKLNFGNSLDDTRMMDADEFATRVLNGPVIIKKDKDGQEDEPGIRKKKKRMRPMAKLAIIAVILGLLAGGLYGLNGFLNVGEVSVPDVKGKTLDEAQRMLEAAGLSYTTQLQFDPLVESGTVIGQDPFAGRTVKRNTKVTLTVSKGAELVTVPDVVRKEQESARIDLENADFKVAPTEEFSEDVPAGAVISQSPEGNAEAVKGSTVKLFISKGKEPAPITVPNLVGLPEEAVKGKLEALKLKLSQDVARQESNEYLSGYVTGQTPAAGSTLQEGEEVKITVSTGPGPEAGEAEVSLEVPNDGMIHRVKISVIDAAGTRVALGPEEHNSGERFTRLVTYYGKGKIQVYIDDRLVKESLVP